MKQKSLVLSNVNQDYVDKIPANSYNFNSLGIRLAVGQRTLNP